MHAIKAKSYVYTLKLSANGQMQKTTELALPTFHSVYTLHILDEGKSCTGHYLSLEAELNPPVCILYIHLDAELLGCILISEDNLLECGRLHHHSDIGRFHGDIEETLS